MTFKLIFPELWQSVYFFTRIASDCSDRIIGHFKRHENQTADRCRGDGEIGRVQLTTPGTEPRLV